MINVNIELPENLPDEAKNGLAMVALIETMVGIAQEMKMTREQFLERMAIALATAWDVPLTT